MRYWENRNNNICLNACDNQFKQRDVTPLLWIHINEDDDNGIQNNIQEIFMTILPMWSTTKDQIILSTKKYRS